MKEIRTEVNIKAGIDRIWAVFSDFEHYGEWNPFIRSLTGDMTVGSRIQALLAPPGGSQMIIKPRVLKFDKNRELRWLGSLGFPGLFDGEHVFELTDSGEGFVHFVQRELFRGILVPLFARFLDENTKQGFEAMNEKLKERCESS